MLATQTPDTLPEAKDVKQRIKERLALSLKALQKCYVTSDDVVTSEDGNANLLCSALEAIFIHGIKSKHIRSEAGVRGRKGARGGSLPQPVFWNLLKTVTHRDVITELEKLSFVGSDVGRCRAWLRLALNHGLLECYLVSLFREGSKLQAHYQPSALLLDAEEREVLLSYLQGLASLAFSLSYKSAVLNEWTTTPLALAGLCPASQADAALLSDPPVNGTPGRKESWDTVSQSSSSGASDTVDVQRGGSGRSNGGLPNGRTGLNSSNLSLDTTGSSQLSSSLSSDSLLQEQDTRSPVGEQWSSCDLDISHHSDGSTKPPFKDKVSQDSMREEDSFASSAGPDPNSEAATFSGSDGESQSPAAPFPEPDDPPSEPLPQQPQPPSTPLLAFVEESLNATSLETKLPPAVPELVTEPEPKSEPEPEPKPEQSDQTPPEAREQKAEVEKVEVEEVTPVEQTPEPLPHMAPRRTTSVLSRKMSSDSVSHPYSWISEDDIYKPHLEELSDQDDSPGTAPDGVNKLTTPSSEPSTPQSPPSVVHRRQKGLANPFRGLLKLGHLERRSAVGRWRDHYCELSPFEFRLYQNAEERTCCDNHYLMRCEDARITSPEGRFELAFSGKRLYLRAANRDEAEDWVDRIVEATEKCRPAPQPDEQWEVLQAPRESGVEDSQPPTPSSTHASPERGSAVAGDQAGARGPAVSPPPLPPTQELDWSRSSDIEPDAIKESVLYLSTDPEARVWAPLVFSLSLEALKGFRLQDGRKALRLSHPIAGIRDVVPDVSLGGADFFKLLTVRETLKLRAKSPEEARSWRGLIRETLDSYLESGEDGDAEEVPAASMGTGGNITRLVQHRLKEDGLLLKYLCTVASEKGLDSQGFKCAGCPKKIGLSMGRARLCEFSAQYYCESCHRGDTTIIPARMVHNWDIEPREVSRKALKLLAQVEQEPLLNVDQLNPDLVEHTESMAQAYDLRQRLRLLGDYLLTCRSGTSKKIQSKLGQRSYLLETSQLYSVLDLRQIAEGQYAAFLSSLVQVASNHVHHCDLCTQRGFICQICHADDIIFPFQFDSTVRCKDCKSVFHIACKARSPSCPRCVRLQSYLERHMQD